MKEVICPYCGAVANFESSTKIYNGQDFGMMYICANYPTCDSYVGVHKGTKMPLGRMANPELRKWKKIAHGVIDKYWRNGKMSRERVYKEVQRIMKMSSVQAHIGKFTVEQCQELVQRFPGSVKPRRILQQ